MVGEFHDGPPDKGGLWNPLLRPLDAPVPMLVVRHMVTTDLPFLTSREEHVSAYRRDLRRPRARPPERRGALVSRLSERMARVAAQRAGIPRRAPGRTRR